MGFTCLCKHLSKSPGVKKSLTWSWGLCKAKRTFLELSVAVLRFSILTPLWFSILFSLLKFNSNKHNTCTLFSVPLFRIHSTRLLNSVLSPPLLPCPPWTAHLQPPIPFTSRKAEAVFTCSPNPCLSYETRTETLWNFYFSSPAVPSGNMEQKEAFVFVVWYLKRNMDSSA